jgi:DNA polymerase elongation subunit (family B)
MSRNIFFPYYSCIDDKETEITAIRFYGLNEQDKSVCLRINDFTPYVYVELDAKYKWDSVKAQLLGNHIDNLLGKSRPLKKGTPDEV